MYTILLNDQNELVATNREAIMQYSKMVKQLRFLVPQKFHGLDMADFNVMMQFVTPVSHKIKGRILKKEEELYTFSDENYLQYIIWFDTDITAEAGDLQLHLGFGKIGMDKEGVIFQQVEKTSPTTIKIIPIAAWADFVPDEMLDPIDQRLLKVEALAKQYEEFANAAIEIKAVDISLDKKNETIRLRSESGEIGSGIQVKDLSQILEEDYFHDDTDGNRDGVIRLDDIV